MTEIEAKALVNRMRERSLSFSWVREVADYIEATEARHAAEMRELKERFSEVAARAKDDLEEWIGSYPATIGGSRDTWAAISALAPFIIPAPDPLAEALASLPESFAHSVDGANALRAAMQARGYEWRKIGDAGE